MRYALQIRREDDPAWFPLAADLEGDFYSWDGRSLPDGRYRARLVADDGPDNTAEVRSSGQRISDLFVVDNSRPVVGEPETRKSDGGWSLAFTARDPGGSVAAAELSIDGGDWRPLTPTDGVADSAEERFEVAIPDRGQAGRTLTVRVRVTDAAGNPGGAMWTIP